MWSRQVRAVAAAVDTAPKQIVVFFAEDTMPVPKSGGNVWNSTI